MVVCYRQYLYKEVQDMKEYPKEFSKEDIGKTFTIREWDDMVEEFPCYWNGNIVGYKSVFSLQMKKYTGVQFTLTNRPACLDVHIIDPWMTLEYRELIHDKKLIPVILLYKALHNSIFD